MNFNYSYTYLEGRLYVNVNGKVLNKWIEVGHSELKYIWFVSQQDDERADFFYNCI